MGKTTLGGLLALGYQVAVSFKRESAIIDNGKVSISIETINDVNKAFIQVKGTDRKVLFNQSAFDCHCVLEKPINLCKQQFMSQHSEEVAIAMQADD